MEIHIDLPRLNLGFFPTPLIFLQRLTAQLGGPALYMKRDDCTGLATGGNKVRKLEFLLADALRQKADTVVTGGGLQSNHARQTAAAAAKLGLGCILVLNESQHRQDMLYQKNGNVVLDHIFNAQLRVIPASADSVVAMQTVCEQLRQEGKHPYLIPIGGSNEIGAIGYVKAAEELQQQCQQQNITATHLVCANGSGGTQAGLAVGKYIQHWDVQLLGFSVGVTNPVEKERVKKVIISTCKSLKIDPAVVLDSYQIDDHYIGVGYGQPTPETISAIKQVAQAEGILLDPVYTGKAMAGLIDYIKKGRFKKTDVIVFIHTGGAAAISAYAEDFYGG